MNDFLNPYIAGAPVVETSMFFGREDVFTWIENSLTGKFVGHILVLHGQRRVGKTSVLKQIPNFLSDDYIQIFFDLQGRTNTTLDRFLWWMASEIVRTVNKRLGSDLPKPVRDQFADPDVFNSEFLPSIQSTLGKHTLLLTFDEFDTLDRPDIQDRLARPLISFLRRLFENKDLNFIFSIGSSGNKLENMQAAYTNFFKTALYRKVSFLTKDECHSLITKPVAGAITYEPAAIDQIIAITSGHPYFTQLTCHELFSRCQKTGSRVVSSADVDVILDDVIERGTVNLKFVWDEASDLEKWILAALGKKEGLSQKELSTTLKSQGVRFVESDLNSAILHLRDKDVLTQDNDLVIHLMKLWLELNRPMDRVREELVQINPIADRYIEIGDEFRDRNQPKEAINSYRQALEHQVNNVAALINIAEIYTEQQNYTEAAAFYEKVLQVDDEHIAARQGYCQVQFIIGSKAQDSGLTGDAIEAYQAILNVTPVHIEARQKLADLYRNQAETHLAGGSEQKGLETLRLAMEMTPEDADLEARYQAILDAKKASLVAGWFDKAERALKRKRWDEAAQMAEEALKVDPDDSGVQQRVVEIRDAPRQEKLKAYKLEAETAITKGDYPRAIVALETAGLLAPEDASLVNWLETTRSDQQNAQLRLYQNQAQRAESTSDWGAAVIARKAALALDPQNTDLKNALKETQTAQHNARLNELRDQSAQARKSKHWDEAINATLGILELEPDNQKAIAELESLKIAKREATLEGLLSQGADAARLEHWAEAVSAWEAYLAEMPSESAQLESRLEKARKYAKLAEDYEAAQEFIRKKQYSRAISKLQGIIAQDPSYKSTSRLLVEAVEASKQRQPVWRKPWVYGVLAGVILFGLVIIFNQQIMAFFSPIQSPVQVIEIETPKTEEGLLRFTQTAEVTPSFTEDTTYDKVLSNEPSPAPFEITATKIMTSTLRPSPTPTPVPSWVTDFAEPILAYIADRPPTFEDKFLVDAVNQKDTYGDAWVFHIASYGPTRSLSVSSGTLTTNAVIVNQFVTYQDYVVEVDMNGHRSGIEFNHGKCCLYNYGITIEIWCNDEDNNFRNIQVFRREINPTLWKNIILIVKGSEVVVYYNKEPIGYIQLENQGLPVYLSLLGWDRNITSYRNFKVWSLTYY